MRLAIPAAAGALLLLGVAILGVADVSHAHSNGQSLEQKIGDYTIDIGYEPAEPRLGESIVLDFGIEENGEEVAFESVWVRIEQKGKTIVAGGLARSSVGPTTLLFVPNVPGSATIHARFEGEGETLAETSFELQVGIAGSASFDYRSLVWAFGGLVLGVIVALVLRRS